MISFLQHSYISFYCSDIINLFLLDYTWYGLCNIRCSTISTHPFSVVPAFSEDISTLSLLKPIKWLKQCKYHPCLSRLASMIQYYKVGKIFEFTVFIFLENALNLGVFTHDTPPPQSPIPTQNYLSSSYHHVLGRGKLLIPLGSIFSKICFSQQQKGCRKLNC